MSLTPQQLTGRAALACHILLFGFVAWGATLWATIENKRSPVPSVNSIPRVVRPQYDLPMVVSDHQLQTVLTKIKPSFQQQPPKTNFVDHALRLWGVDIEFTDDAIDGRELRQLLIDSQMFRRIWGEQEPPLLESTLDGIRVRVQEGSSTVSHVDHLLASLAEVGTTLDHPVALPDGQPGNVGDMLERALLTFRLNQKEYEWTVLALAFYVADNRPWYTQEGEQVDFDRFCKRIMRQVLPQGVCYGQHRLYTLTMLLRIDDQMAEQATRLLSDSTRAEVISFLKDTTKKLYKSQSRQGYWDGNWADTSVPVRDPKTKALSRQILATGHTLEWWAMAPRELHPPRETIVRAGQWLATQISEMEPTEIEKNYTFLTHAARALALWRGKFADEHFTEFEESPISLEIPTSSPEKHRKVHLKDRETKYDGPLSSLGPSF